MEFLQDICLIQFQCLKNKRLNHVQSMNTYIMFEEINKCER